MCKKVGGRHLLRVAGDDDLFTAREGTYSVPDGNLRCFVEDDDVEQRLIGRQILGDGSSILNRYESKPANEN